MKRSLLLFLIVFSFANNVFSRSESDSIMQYLFKLIDNKEVYAIEKENRIAEKKRMLNVHSINKDQTYLINRDLYSEYKSYISDSAIYYMEENLRIAESLNGTTWIYDSKIALSFLYSVAGRYLDAYKMLSDLDRNEFNNQPEWLLPEYYGAYKQLYLYHSLLDEDFTQNYYYKKSNLYRDSLLMITDSGTYFHKILKAEKIKEEKKITEAKEMLLSLYRDNQGDEHEKAIVAFILSNIYKEEGDRENQKKYLAISAINDIKNAIKENASMQALALHLYEDGDIVNAHKCIQSSMEDAQFCKARFRTIEINNIYPIIDAAYKEKIAQQKKQLQAYLVLVSVLSLFLIIAVIYVYRQMKKISRIRKELASSNLKLNELNNDLKNSNEKLHLVNEQLTDANMKLVESNVVKEAYLGKFIDLCSSYIDKIDNYRRHLSKIAMSGKVEELYRSLKSTQFIEDELNDFYINFDETFLHIYPTFINDFNALFPESEKQIPKQGELLNTELRIYALIKLGINDSAKISLFLRCSKTTIYTYRSKLKKKSLHKDSFEEYVMKIGAFN